MLQTGTKHGFPPSVALGCAAPGSPAIVHPAVSPPRRALGGGEAMPNEVYEMTHTALSALVSQRAATRVLDVALQAGGADADTVTVRAMRRLLAGRIRRELSGTLPSPGLTRSLKQIADDLYRLRPSHKTRVEMIPHDEPAAAEGGADPTGGQATAAEARAGAGRQPEGTVAAGRK